MAITLGNDNLDANTAIVGEASSGTVRANIAANQFLVLCIYIDDTTEGAFSSISDEDTNTFDLRANFTNGNQNFRIYTVTNPTVNADNTITVNFTAATDFGLDVHTYNGVDKTTPFDHASSGSGTSATPSVTFSLTSNDSLVVFAAGWSQNGITPSYGALQNDRGSNSQGGGEKTAIVNSSEIVTATGSNDQTCVVSKSGAFVAAAIEINADAAAPAAEIVPRPTIINSSVMI